MNTLDMQMIPFRATMRSPLKYAKNFLIRTSGWNYNGLSKSFVWRHI